MNDLLESARTIRVLIADDHPVMRQGLRFTLEQEPDMEVVAEASDGAEAIEQFHIARPDICLMDLQMPNVDGLQAIIAIRAAVLNAPIVVLTTYPGDARVTRAISLGATSYILKTASSDEIVATLRSALTGRTIVAKAVARDVAAHLGMENLTPRELSVLRLVALGKSNRSIGEALNVTEETVKTRVKNILAKLNANDRTHAVTMAVRRGFIDA